MPRLSPSLLLIALLGSACQIDSLDLEGKTCPCGDGFLCVNGRCTSNPSTQTDAATPDATTPDAATPDATPDAADATSEAEGGGGCGAPVTLPQPTLTAGTRHTCAIMEGALYCWGNNDHGQLGLGDTEQRSSPERVGTESDWLTVSAGSGHTCGIRSSSGFGALFCWGNSEYGQCGLGSETAMVPTQVTQNVGFRWIAAGDSHTCGLATGGKLWCWGRQAGGSVGLGNLGDPMTTPARVSEIDTYVHISAGRGHNCAVRDDAALLCWGHFECMQLGSPDHQITPHQVDSQCWRAAATGATHSCAIRNDGALHCFGSNSHGELGFGTLGGGEPGYEGCLSYPEPQLVAGDHHWAMATAGTAHTCGITDNGQLYCWGYNEQRQVADNDSINEPAPVRMGTASNWVEVAGGFFHTCARNENDEIFCRGINEDGQQGTGGYNPQLTQVTF